MDKQEEIDRHYQSLKKYDPFESDMPKGQEIQPRHQARYKQMSLQDRYWYEKMTTVNRDRFEELTWDAKTAHIDLFRLQRGYVEESHRRKWLKKVLDRRRKKRIVLALKILFGVLVLAVLLAYALHATNHPIIWSCFALLIFVVSGLYAYKFLWPRQDTESNHITSYSVVAKPKPVFNYPPMYREPKPQKTYYGSASWDDPYIIHTVYTKRNSSHDAVAGFYIGGGYRIEHQMHGVIIAGTGQGKGVCSVLPNLLCIPHCSWFIIDIKSENALLTAGFQKRAGQKVCILDPWGEQKRLGAKHGIEPACFNPLTFVKNNPDEMPESCGAIAHLLVPEAADSKEEFWANRARVLIKTYLLHIVTMLPEKQQHLGKLYDWLSLSIKDRGPLWEEMQSNMSCGGAVKKGIDQFIDLNPHDGPLPSIITTAQANTEFLESQAIRRSISKNDFDSDELANGKTTVYVCLPERYLDTHHRWLRLVTGVCLKSVNHRPQARVNFLLDEFAILGKMKDIQRAYAFSRGNKINIFMYVQTLDQLFEIYGKHGANAFLANARFRQFFGIFDLDTQKYLSEYVGETTLKYITESVTTGYSSSTTAATFLSPKSNTEGDSYSITHSENFIARRLKTSEEVGKAADIITFIDGYKFRLIRMPYWDNIYKAHKSGRGQYSAFDQEDWKRFIDELESREPRRSGLTMDKYFLDRIDKRLINIDESQKMNIG